MPASSGKGCTTSAKKLDFLYIKYLTIDQHHLL